MMFHFVLPIVPEKVEAKTVLGRLDQREETMLELGPVRRVHLAFKDGILNSLAIVQARLRHTTQSLSSCRRYGRDVVCHQYQHRSINSPARLLPEKWRIRIQITPQVSRQQPRLQMREKANRRLLSQERVRDDLLLPLLVGS